MLKKLLFITSLALSVSAYASEMNQTDTMAVHISSIEESIEMVQPITPTYLDDVLSTKVWSDNWFFAVTGGASAFGGKPLGCEDLFGRIKPTFTVSLGKWFTPAIGGRFVFQGLDFKDCCLQNKEYKNVHADFLWNVASHFNRARDQPRWDVVPFVGCGVIHNETDGGKPFAMSYGLLARCRLADRLHLNLELGGTTTFRDFDGLGDSRKMGDNLFGLTAGLSVTLGRVGFRRVVDARPYIRQNDYLMAHAYSLSDENNRLLAKVNNDARVMAELKKILEIEGLLEIYGDYFREDSTVGISPTNLALGYPKNDYSGLNSLRARLREQHPSSDDNTNRKSLRKKKRNGNVNMNGADTITTSVTKQVLGTGSFGNLDEDAWDDYIEDILNGKACIGAPIYFFFKLNTAEMTEPSQLVNIDEIARIAKYYDLRIRVTGAADSATGNENINKQLSNRRADYIAELLIARGVQSERIARYSEGGINTYTPIQANRSVVIELLPPLK